MTDPFAASVFRQTPANTMSGLPAVVWRKRSTPTPAVTLRGWQTSTTPPTVRCARSIRVRPPCVPGGEDRATADSATSAGAPRPSNPDRSSADRFATDIPSFTVEALPAETFEALLVVASWIVKCSTTTRRTVSRWCCANRWSVGAASTSSQTLAPRPSACRWRRSVGRPFPMSRRCAMSGQVISTNSTGTDVSTRSAVGAEARSATVRVTMPRSCAYEESRITRSGRDAARPSSAALAVWHRPFVEAEMAGKVDREFGATEHLGSGDVHGAADVPQVARQAGGSLWRHRPRGSGSAARR